MAGLPRAPLHRGLDEAHGLAPGENVAAAPPPWQYVLLHESVRDHPGVIAVHAAHAAGESCFDGPAPGDTRVVVLVAKDSAALLACAAQLSGAGIRHALIVETDGLRAGQATALGTTPTRDRERVRPFFTGFKALR